MKIAMILAFLLGSSAFAGSVTCSDSKGQISYQARTFSYGIPPNSSSPRVRMEEVWTFQGTELAKMVSYDNGKIEKTGASITVAFDDTSKKTIEFKKISGTTYEVYSIQLKIAAMVEPPFSDTRWVLCEKTITPPVS